MAFFCRIDFCDDTEGHKLQEVIILSLAWEFLEVAKKERRISSLRAKIQRVKSHRVPVGLGVERIGWVGRQGESVILLPTWDSDKWLPLVVPVASWRLGYISETVLSVRWSERRL